jgi:hypothetical protein
VRLLHNSTVSSRWMSIGHLMGRQGHRRPRSVPRTRFTTRGSTPGSRRKPYRKRIRWRGFQNSRGHSAGRRSRRWRGDRARRSACAFQSIARLSHFGEHVFHRAARQIANLLASLRQDESRRVMSSFIAFLPEAKPPLSPVQWRAADPAPARVSATENKARPRGRGPAPRSRGAPAPDPIID